MKGENSSKMNYPVTNDKRNKGIRLLENWLKELEGSYSNSDVQTNIKTKSNNEKRFTSWETLPDTLTALHISEYLHISRRRVYELFLLHNEEGGIPYYNIGASKRVNKSDFKKWISKKKNSTI